MTLRGYLELCKLRIGVMIALTAMVGYAAIAPTVDPLHLLVLAVAMVLGSASSSIFNHYYDRDIDRLMQRTSKRPLVTGGNPQAALWLAGVLLLAGLWLSVGVFNWVVALHLFLGAFFYGVVYTVWLKRRTAFNIVIGGAAGSFAILAGGAAVDPGQWLLPTLMAVVLFLWTPSHFWALAIMLKDDYSKAGVPMLPVLVGEQRCARWITANSVLLVMAAALPWVLGILGLSYALISTLTAVLFLRLHGPLLKDPGKPTARAVFLGSMQYLAGVFLGVVIDRHIVSGLSWPF